MPEFTLDINANDKASDDLEDVDDSMDDMDESMQDTAESTSHFADILSAELVAEGLTMATEWLQQGAQAAIQYTNRIADTAVEVDRLSEATGIQIDELQSLRGVYKRADAGADQLRDNIFRLSERFQEAEARSGGMRDDLLDAGYTMEEVARLAEKPDEALKSVLERLKEAPSRMEAMATAEKVLGGEAQQLVTFLRSQEDALGDVIEESEDFAQQFSEQEIKNLKEYRKETDKLATSWKEFSTDLLMKVVPDINDALSQLNRGVGDRVEQAASDTAVRDVLSENFREGSGRMTDTLAQMRVAGGEEAQLARDMRLLENPFQQLPMKRLERFVELASKYSSINSNLLPAIRERTSPDELQYPDDMNPTGSGLFGGDDESGGGGGGGDGDPDPGPTDDLTRQRVRDLQRAAELETEIAEATGQREVHLQGVLDLLELRMEREEVRREFREGEITDQQKVVRLAEARQNFERDLVENSKDRAQVLEEQTSEIDRQLEKGRKLVEESPSKSFAASEFAAPTATTGEENLRMEGDERPPTAGDRAAAIGRGMSRGAQGAIPAAGDVRRKARAYQELSSAIGGAVSKFTSLTEQEQDFATATKASAAAVGALSSAGQAAAGVQDSRKKKAQFRAGFESAAAAAAFAAYASSGFTMQNMLAASIQHGSAAAMFGALAGSGNLDGQSGRPAGGGGGGGAGGGVSAPSYDVGRIQRRSAKMFAEELAREQRQRPVHINVDMSNATTLEDSQQTAQRVAEEIDRHRERVSTGELSFEGAG